MTVKGYLQCRKVRLHHDYIAPGITVIMLQLLDQGIASGREHQLVSSTTDWSYECQFLQYELPASTKLAAETSTSGDTSMGAEWPELKEVPIDLLDIPPHDPLSDYELAHGINTSNYSFPKPGFKKREMRIISPQEILSRLEWYEREDNKSGEKA